MLTALALSTVLHIERVTTPQAQVLGLSYRKSLPKDYGMLFVFPKEQNLSFWMHEMNFPLDIIWLDKDCKVVDISANQQPCESNKACPTISPGLPAQYVLEIASGGAEKYQLNIGQKIDICQ